MDQNGILISHFVLELSDGLRKGWLSMSPTVPPTSMMAISVSVSV